MTFASVIIQWSAIVYNVCSDIGACIRFLVLVWTHDRHNNIALVYRKRHIFLGIRDNNIGLVGPTQCV